MDVRIALGIALARQGFFQLLHPRILPAAGKFKGAFQDRLLVHTEITVIGGGTFPLMHVKFWQPSPRSGGWDCDHLSILLGEVRRSAFEQRENLL